MPITFDDSVEVAPSKKKATFKEEKTDLKGMFNNADGKRMVRDSMAANPLSKKKRKIEMERLRKSFKLGETEVNDLKSCLMVKSTHGAVDRVKWRESTCLVASMRISKVRASCWDDMFYTQDELADFKYLAFMEECGLNPDDFD
jgi:hypothetical protein